MKQLMGEAVAGGGLDVHLDRELDALVRVADGPDFAEGLRAFFAREVPAFHGR